MIFTFDDASKLAESIRSIAACDPRQLTAKVVFDLLHHNEVQHVRANLAASALAGLASREDICSPGEVVSSALQYADALSDKLVDRQTDEDISAVHEDLLSRMSPADSDVSIRCEIVAKSQEGSEVKSVTDISCRKSVRSGGGKTFSVVCGDINSYRKQIFVDGELQECRED